jgi:hypothetical protein
MATPTQGYTIIPTIAKLDWEIAFRANRQSVTYILRTVGNKRLPLEMFLGFFHEER